MPRPTLITVSGTYLKMDGTPEVGTISFRTRGFVLDGDSSSVLVPSSMSATLNGAGSFSLQVPATDDPDWTPVGWTYEIVLNLSESQHKYHVQVPYDAPSASVSISDLTPVVPAAGTMYASYAHEHTGYVTQADLESEVSAIVGPAVDDAVAGSLANYAPLASPTFTGTVSGITKAMVGLGSVDNTSDASKPISTATQNALNLKAPLASPTFTGTVSGITKSMVGLGSVDNTSDASKPISTATQTALDLKAPLASPTFTGTVSGITKAMVGLGSVDNTSDASKPVSTATQTALNAKAAGPASSVSGNIPSFADTTGKVLSDSGLSAATLGAQITDLYGTKANIASPTFTGTVSGITKAMVGLGSVDNTADTDKPISTLTQSALNLKASLVDISSLYRPTDNNFVGWTLDPTMVQAGTILATAGLSYVVRIRVLTSLVTNIHFHFTAGGATLTSGQCFASLHTDAGVQLAATSDQATNWASGGYKTCVLSSPQTVTPGSWYKVRFWFNGTTGPTLSRAVNSSTAITNAGLSAPNFRFATADSGLTTAAGAPSTIGTMTGGATAWWVALS